MSSAFEIFHAAIDAPRPAQDVDVHVNGRRVVVRASGNIALYGLGGAGVGPGFNQMEEQLRALGLRDGDVVTAGDLSWKAQGGYLSGIRLCDAHG